MKKRVFCMALALVLTLGLAIPAFAATEEPEYRLASVTTLTSGSTASVTYTFAYEQGGYLPTVISMMDNAINTVAYDDVGRIVSDDTSTYAYDGRGNLAEKTTSELMPVPDENGYPTSEVATVTRRIAYTYDENGNVLTETEEAEMGEEIGEYAGKSTGYKTYKYDEHGSCISVVYSSLDDNAEESEYSYTYTYDDEGKVTSETSYYNGEPGETTAYEYDEEGREVETKSSDEVSRTYYIPLLGGTWNNSIWYLDDGTTESHMSFQLELCDTVGNNVCFFSITCDAEPQLTYDDNGYLIKVDDGAGNYIELTYEPVA